MSCAPLPHQARQTDIDWQLHNGACTGRDGMCMGDVGLVEDEGCYRPR